MSVRYLVTCPACQKQLPVEAGRAGGVASCVCAAAVDIPPMRVLRTLPQELMPATGSQPGVDRANANWGLRQGLMLLGVLLILAGGGLALNKTIKFPKPPYLTHQELENMADVEFDKMNLTDSWVFWKTFIEPQGLTNEPSPQEHDYLRRAAEARQWLSIYYTIAGVGVALVVAGFFIPSQR